MGDPVWISTELTLAIHSRQLAEHGGAEGTRDLALLESALARPQQAFRYADPAPSPTALAAAYAFGIARNHAFIDGNKRTAAVVCETFLILNGWKLIANDVELYPLFLSLASGDLRETIFAAWLADHSARI